ncbi:hypothetical protein [Streptomyces lomondensis]|uniref:Lipoprotein n=1 Tax=Streptomyces lomondensis TaxID=68229 RepID=A0ABQ2XSB8_9ACTN|nr:hypothetical protein [Streptomyces lomondensis]MCF0082344.1 hypothetical protein [Streptomyces lomondensis]GGX29676.1 hypothetical protein GCM10010383_70310 [Streptomyces lomondensis]
MSTSTSARRAPLAAAALVLVAGLTLTACGELRARDATAGAAPSASGASSPSAAGASPYVEPGAGDGAPHYNENNAHRRPGEMSPAHAEDAEREADRIRPVLKRLWERHQWDPASVRTALLRLGYEEERVSKDGKRLGGTLTVTAMDSRYQDGGYVTPEGAMVGLRVHDDACVMAFVQKSNFEARANGPYLETGCFPPPFAH